MAIDFGGVATTDNYSTAFIPKINEAIKYAVWMGDPTYASYTGTPITGAKRVNAGVLEQFNGTSWVAASINGLSFTGGQPRFGISPVLSVAGPAIYTAAGTGGAAASGGAFYANNGGGTIAAFGEYATIYGGAVQNAAAIYSANWLSLGASGAEQARLTSVGLGLGIAPNNRLEVNGNISVPSSNAMIGYNPVGQNFTVGSNSVAHYGMSIGVGNLSNTGLHLSGYYGLAFYTAATERARFDGSGNFGHGVTPFAWSTGWKAIDQNTYGALTTDNVNDGATHLANNTYASGVTTWNYKTNLSSGAGRFVINGGAFKWFTAAAGAANAAVSFTQAMTLSTAGDLMTTGIIKAAGVSGSGDVMLVNGSGGATGYLAFYGSGGNRQGYVGASATNAATDSGTIPYVAGTHSFAGAVSMSSTLVVVSSASANNFVASGPEGFRVKADSGYLCGFNSANTVRSGYLQFATTGLNLVSEVGPVNIGATTRIVSTRAHHTSSNTVAFSATPTVDASASNFHIVGALTANVTSVTINNTQEGQFLTIRFTQDATGGRTITTGNMGAPNAPSISGTPTTTANKSSYLNITYNAAAARWEGSWLATQ